MSDSDERRTVAGGQVDPQRVEHRADGLLPEELAAGSDDPDRQAEVLLADSDERTENPEQGARESTQTATR